MFVWAWLQALRLRYTPRHFVIHPDHKTLLVAEADHAAIPAVDREPLAPLENGAAMETEDGIPLSPEEIRAQGLNASTSHPCAVSVSLHVSLHGACPQCLHIMHVPSLCPPQDMGNCH